MRLARAAAEKRCGAWLSSCGASQCPPQSFDAAARGVSSLTSSRATSGCNTAAAGPEGPCPCSRSVMRLGTSASPELHGPSRLASRLAGFAAALGAAVCGGTALASLPHSSSEGVEIGSGSCSRWQLIPEELQALTFFKYEKRLRTHSDAEKIFDYFSSVKHGKKKYMTEADLMRSVVPVYPVDGVRTGSLDGESSAPKYTQTTNLGGVIDSDGDDRISFPEYLFFLKLMSIGVEDLETLLRMADVDRSGCIDKDEMLAVVGWEKGAHQRGITRTGLNVDSPGSGSFIPQLFGSDGKQLPTLSKVKAFLIHLHEDLAELEFRHYDSHVGEDAQASPSPTHLPSALFCMTLLLQPAARV
mmetsp:Transcript_1866/g.5431  ORF Transcript_1866/g.5431 Transcript_1866/m.5431 type:complete len:358 (-) Transcript_1866:706-1779(-)